MRPTKPNRPYDAPEFDSQLVLRLAPVLDCVPAREERLLHSFLFGACGLPQCSRGAEQIGRSEPLVGHA